MKTLSESGNRVITPNVDESRVARSAARLLERLEPTPEGRETLRIIPDHEETAIEVPSSAFRLFVDILNQMAQGNAMMLVPAHHELTTQQAADMLLVSRPYFVKLLESNQIPFRRVGPRRRVKFSDLLAYMEKSKSDSNDALRELAAQAQELDMGYDGK